MTEVATKPEDISVEVRRFFEARGMRWASATSLSDLDYESNKFTRWVGYRHMGRAEDGWGWQARAYRGVGWEGPRFMCPQAAYIHASIENWGQP